jgi:hypothetical protein
VLLGVAGARRSSSHSTSSTTQRGGLCSLALPVAMHSPSGSHPSSENELSAHGSNAGSEQQGAHSRSREHSGHGRNLCGGSRSRSNSRSNSRADSQAFSEARSQPSASISGGSSAGSSSGRAAGPSASLRRKKRRARKEQSYTHSMDVQMSGGYDPSVSPRLAFFSSLASSDRDSSQCESQPAGSSTALRASPVSSSHESTPMEQDSGRNSEPCEPRERSHSAGADAPSSAELPRRSSFDTALAPSEARSQRPVVAPRRRFSAPEDRPLQIPEPILLENRPQRGEL